MRPVLRLAETAWVGRHTLMRGAALAVAMLAAPEARAAPVYTNFIANGSFQTYSPSNAASGASTQFTNWVQSTAGATGATLGITDGSTANKFNDVIVSDNAASPYPNADKSGNRAVYFYDDTGITTLSQTFTLAAGATYEAGFDFLLTSSGARNNGGFTFNATVAGISVLSLSVANGALSGTGYNVANAWQHVAANFLSTSGGTYTFVFSFVGNGAPSKDVLVDNVYVINPSSDPNLPVTVIPEPGALALLGGGLLILGGLRRRTSGQAAAV